jgi:ATP phosphoribosyltransferase
MIDSGFLNIALPKGRLGEKVYAMLEKAGYPCPEVLGESRKLIFENPDAGVRYFWVKPSDVAIYVERGAADLGVAGKDILLEYEPDVYELTDRHTGVCRMAVAAKKGFKDDPEKTLRVATKFSHIARGYYAGKGRDIDIITNLTLLCHSETACQYQHQKKEQHDLSHTISPFNPKSDLLAPYSPHWFGSYTVPSNRFFSPIGFL